MSMETKLNLEAIEAAEQAATPGPWEVKPTSDPTQKLLIRGDVFTASTQMPAGDAELCQILRNNAKALVSRIRELEAENEELRMLMEVYEKGICPQIAKVLDNAGVPTVVDDMSLRLDERVGYAWEERDRQIAEAREALEDIAVCEISMHVCRSTASKALAALSGGEEKA